MNDESELTTFLDELEEDEGDNLTRLRHRLYRSTGPNKDLIATFTNVNEALLCMAAIGRILQTPVYLLSQEDPTKTLPLPNGCSVDWSGIVFRP
jgi:hypothetical protein